MARRKEGHVLNLVSIIVSFALIIVFGVVGFAFMYKTFKTMETLRQDQTRVHEANLAVITTKDPTTGKILLDDAFLREEYRYYHEGVVNGNQTFQLIMKGFIVAGLGICLLSATIPILKAAFRGDRIPFLKSALGLLPMIFVIAFYFIVGGKMTNTAKPVPEEARYKIYTLKILNRKEITTTDSDGDTHTTYKIYYESNQDGTVKELNVTGAMFNSVPEYTLPSEYYLVEAGDGYYTKNFAFYYPEIYQVPQLP